MIEKFNRLLDDEQQLVLQMAELYIHDPEKKLSISYLQSELGVSRHQVLMAFDLLKDTVASLNLKNIDLAYDGKGIIAMYGLTTSLLKQLLESQYYGNPATLHRRNFQLSFVDGSKVATGIV